MSLALMVWVLILTDGAAARQGASRDSLLTGLSAPGELPADALGVAWTDSVRVGPDGSLRLRPFLLKETLTLFVDGVAWEGRVSLNDVEGVVVLG
ncbi:MAG: hypothetical protein HKN29_15870, partial [Rhodothermales bacterium]|nr:hypothetical protein [Rhodothermales bacterium]